MDIHMYHISPMTRKILNVFRILKSSKEVNKLDEHNGNCDWKGATNVNFKRRREL